MSAFKPTIDAESSTPPFRQLHLAVVAGVAAGSLTPGSRLPTVRALADSLGIATNTVASAYRSLEAAGVVEGRGRAGTFVSDGDDPIATRAREIARDAAAAFAELGVDRDRAAQLLADAFGEI
ncbi:GntR family transcriptional regulator [Leucobacter sp. BZR 635]